jgi:hypothetical protein
MLLLFTTQCAICTLLLLTLLFTTLCAINLHVITTTIAHCCVMSINTNIDTLTEFQFNFAIFWLRAMDSTCYQQNKARRPFTSAQPSSSIHHDTSFPMLKEHLPDAIDELVSVSNRCKINSLIKKFDTEATKVHHMM